MSPKIPNHLAASDQMGNTPVSGDSATTAAGPPSKLPLQTTFPKADAVSSEAVWNAARSAANENATAGANPSQGGADIEAAAFITMMNATTSAQNDLQAIMDGVKASNSAKGELRLNMTAAGAAAPAPSDEEANSEKIKRK